MIMLLVGMYGFAFGWFKNFYSNVFLPHQRFDKWSYYNKYTFSTAMQCSAVLLHIIPARIWNDTAAHLWYDDNKLIIASKSLLFLWARMYKAIINQYMQRCRERIDYMVPAFFLHHEIYIFYLQKCYLLKFVLWRRQNT